MKAMEKRSGSALSQSVNPDFYQKFQGGQKEHKLQ